MTQPFADARKPEVLARVVFQLVKAEWKRQKRMGTMPGTIISTVIRELNTLGLSDLRLYASSMYWQVVSCRGVSSKWLNEVVRRSRLGYDLRAACYTGYKATRRDPRVTNRGVGLRIPLSPADEDYEQGFATHSGDNDD